MRFTTLVCLSSFMFEMTSLNRQYLESTSVRHLVPFSVFSHGILASITRRRFRDRAEVSEFPAGHLKLRAGTAVPQSL